MIVLFLTLVTCRDFEMGNIINQQTENESGFEALSLKGQVCRNKNFFLSMAAMFIFSIFFGKFWNRYMERKKKRMEVRQKKEELELNKKKNE